MRALLALNKYPSLKRRFRALADRMPMPGGERMTTLRLGPLKGLQLPLDLSTDDRHLWLNSYEPWVQATLLGVLRPGMVVWDVGAFIGYYVALACKLTGAQVLAVEPDSDNIRRMERTIVANDLRRITVVAAAVGREEGEGSFDNDGMVGALRSGGAVTVPITTLDRLAEKYGRPDLILMDIEGGEVDALRGGSILLGADAPQLLIELHGQAGIIAANHLAALGYDLKTQAGTSIDVQMSCTHRVHALATQTA